VVKIRKNIDKNLYTLQSLFKSNKTLPAMLLQQTKIRVFPALGPGAVFSYQGLFFLF
jgi:hypothetical protein